MQKAAARLVCTDENISTGFFHAVQQTWGYRIVASDSDGSIVTEFLEFTIVTVAKHDFPRNAPTFAMSRFGMQRKTN